MPPAPNLYAAGEFLSLDGQFMNYIARWDGQSWSPVAGGVGGWVFALKVFNDGSGPALFVGGAFNRVGDYVLAPGIARWNGHEWSALGDGLDGPPFALEVFDEGSGPALYVGGRFHHAGGTNVANIARWDGGQWSGVHSLKGNVDALQAFDDGTGSALYASSNHQEPGGDIVGDVVRWNGHYWSPVGSPADGPVYTMTVFNDGSGSALYAGGAFDRIGGCTSVACRAGTASVGRRSCPGRAIRC